MSIGSAMGGSGDPDGERGQAVVIVALAITALLAAVGLGADAALLFVERRNEQVAADAAAFAAGVAIAKNWTAPDRATRARDAALRYAATNGYNNDGTTNTVTVKVPPATGAYAGNAQFAEVRIAVDVRTVFMRTLGPGFQTRRVEARAVGGVTGPLKPYAIIALSKTACPGIALLGGGSGRRAEIETEDAGILVNASCSSAINMTGKARLEVEQGGVEVVGGTTLTGNAQIDGTVTKGVAPGPDPLSYLVPPSVTTPGSMKQGSCQNVGTGTYPLMEATSGTCTLNPGVYAGIRATGTGKIKLLPGTYAIAGFGLTAIGDGRIEDDTVGDLKGVFVYNACSSYPAPGGVCGAITIGGNGRIELEKETSGAYAGLSIWQPCENTQKIDVNGGGTDETTGAAGADDGDDDEDGELETTGTIYAPCAAVDVSGHGEIEVQNGQLVADTVTVRGSAEIEVDWDSSTNTVNRVPGVFE